ncbi:MAG TPA: type II toxin-antitoxin system HicB family antitoxin [Longimicrobium sp.]|nr:type II toxin-antitoxin system HicB family antitoxin [Longimicrobium sp.]
MNSPLENREIRLRGLDRGYVATVQRNERWWIGWVDEVPGVNSQGESREELMENLGSALHEALEMR